MLQACKSGNETPVVTVKQINHDLTGYFIKSIAFDSKGSAWLGTFNQGLVKYNSAETVLYDSKSTNNIFPDNVVIWDVVVDKDDNVWIGTSVGLFKFDGINFTKYNSTNSSMPEDFVSCIAVDRNNRIWFSSSRFKQGGLVQFDGTNFTVYTPENSNLPGNMILSIDVDGDNNVWVALGDAVAQISLAKISNGKVQAISNKELSFTPYYISKIHLNSKDKLIGGIDYSLSSTWSHSNEPVLFSFDGKTSTIIKNEEFERGVDIITIDKNDRIWCSRKGSNIVRVFDGTNWQIPTEKMPDDIFSIKQAPDGKIWIGTSSGVYVYK